MHGFNGPVGLFSHLFLTQADSADQIIFQAGDNRVVLDIPDTEDTGCTAFLCQKGEAIFNRFAGIAVADFLSVQEDLSAVTGHRTEEVFQNFGSAGTVQTGNTEDFSFM